jgi:hypothetical protein
MAMATAMATVKVSEVATVLARLTRLDRRTLNQELDVLCEIDYQALENRFNMGNYRELMETVLDRWVQKFAGQATIGVLCRALECNGDQLASGRSP